MPAEPLARICNPGTHTPMHISLYDPDEALDEMARQIDRYKIGAQKRRGRTPYLSALLLDSNTVSTRVIDGHVGDENRESRNDVLVTAHYRKGGIGRAVAFTPSGRQVHHALQRAEHEAYQGFLQQQGICLLHPEKPNGIHRVTLDLTSVAGLTYKWLSNQLAECENAIASIHGIISSQALVEIYAGREIFSDSLGRHTIQDFGRIYIYLTAVARADDMPDGRFELEDILACSGTVPELETLFEEAKVKAKSLANRALQFSLASDRAGDFKLTAREYKVVMDGPMAGVTIHELGAGHFAEADRFLHQGETGDPFYLGKRVGMHDLTIIDNPRLTVNGVKPPSYYEVDHEGVVVGGPTCIVRNGIFRSYLTSRRSAGTLSTDEIKKFLTANGRIGKVAQIDENDNYHPLSPESRMSTLWIQPVKRCLSLDDLKALVAGEGLYITTNRGWGEAHTEKSQGEVRIEEAYFVTKDLELIPVRIPGRTLVLGENVVSYMGKIKAIGDATTVRYESNWCESESGVVPQSCGGAAIYVEGIPLAPRRLRGAYRKPLTPVPSR